MPAGETVHDQPVVLGGDPERLPDERGRPGLLDGGVERQLGGFSQYGICRLAANGRARIARRHADQLSKP